MSYEKSRVLLEICEKFASIGEVDLESQTRKRVIDLLMNHDVNARQSGKEPTMVEMPKQEEIKEVEEQEIEELIVREIHGLRLAWNPGNNHCYELLTNDEVGKWLGIYDSSTGRVDFTMPDPESKEPNWTNQPAIGNNVDIFKKDSLRRILMHGEEVAVSTSSYKADGTSTIASSIPKILAVNKPGGALGFIYQNTLYTTPYSLIKAVYPGKKSYNGWHSLCLRRPTAMGEMKWKSLYVLDHS
jgi:hypothetical protein